MSSRVFQPFKKVWTPRTPDSGYSSLGPDPWPTPEVIAPLQFEHMGTGATLASASYFAELRIARLLEPMGAGISLESATYIGGNGGTPLPPAPLVSLPAAYELLFQDEFDHRGIDNDLTWLVPYGSAIGSAKWSAGQPNNEFDTDGTREDPGVDGYPYSTDLGYLTLSWFEQSPRNGGAIMSSVDSSYNGFAVKHGYFEFSFQLPVALPDASGETSGLWPAFWLQSIGANPSGVGPELDIFEGYSVDGPFPTLITTWHLWNPDGSQLDALGWKFDPTGAGAEDLSYTAPPGTPNFTEGWNTIGCLITATQIQLWVNGILSWTTPNPDDTAFGLKMFPLIDTAYGGGWPLNFVWTGVPNFPNVAGPPAYLFNLRYVRIWGDPAEQ